MLRIAGITVGLAGGLGVGLLAAGGDLIAAGAAILGALVLAVLVRLVETEAPSGLAAIVGLAYAGRLALLGALHQLLVSLGHGGYLLGDEIAYAQLSSDMAQWLHGAGNTVHWFGQSYLMSVFVYLQTAIFFVFGEQLALMKVLNTLFAAILVVLLYVIARRLFGRPAALATAALTGFFPSLVLWSVLNLKDAFSLLLVAVAVWSVIRFAQGERSWRLVVPLVVSFLVLESVRRYLFLMLGVLAPVAFFVSVTHPLAVRVRYAAASFAIWAVIWVAGANGYLGPIYFSDPLVRFAFIESGLLPASARAPEPVSLEALERQRRYAAVGARTAFTDPALSGQAPLVAKEGERFVVQDATASATSEPSGAPPTPTPRLVHVRPGARIVLGSAGPTLRDAVIVQPGDIVVVGAGGGEGIPRALPMRPGADNLVEVVDARDAEANATTLLRLAIYLPRGLVFALAAPFPWTARTTIDLLTVPEMLLWYLILALAITGAIRERQRWRTLFIVGAMGAGLFFVLALTEGNVGTLFRHRAMTLPFVFLLASPMIPRLAPLLPQLWTRRRPGRS